MSLAAELACPQCGAPVSLDESDRLVVCPYCNVRNFLAAPHYHFILPPKPGEGEIVFAPYLRFKGTVYCCDGREVSYRIADVTCRGLPMKALPLSLGVRPQAVKLRFANPGHGIFLKNYATIAQAIESVTNVMSAQGTEARRWVNLGETVSLIHLPIRLRHGRAVDALSGDPLGRLPEGEDLFAPVRDPGYDWQPQPLAALCPDCGWNLDGEPCSVALVCRQCDTAWAAAHGAYKQVAREGFVSPRSHEGDVGLPFWKVSVRFARDPIRSRADFVRLTGQPVAIRPEWESQPHFFWSPAFKIRPKVYLQASRQLTVTQPETGPAGAWPKILHPVTMPASEAVESGIVTLAHAAVRKKEVLEILPGLRIESAACALVSIPFFIEGQDLVQPDLGMAINQKALEFGLAL